MKKVSLYVGSGHIMDFDLIEYERGENIVIHNKRAAEALVRGAHEYIPVTANGSLSKESLLKFFNYHMGGNFTIKEYIDHIIEHGFRSPYQINLDIIIK